jgi:hypothetical protein
MDKLLDKLTDLILTKFGRGKTLVGLLLMVAVEVIRHLKPDLLTAELAATIWTAGSVLAGVGVGHKIAKREVARNGKSA